MVIGLPQCETGRIQHADICLGVFSVTYAIMFVINLIPGCHFRSSEEAEIVGIDEVELGEYVADYAYHNRDLEGHGPFPPRHYYPSAAALNEAEKHGHPGASTSASDVSPRKNELPLERRASPRDAVPVESPSHSHEVYPGGRGEGRMIYPDGDEAVTEKRG